LEALIDRVLAAWVAGVCQRHRLVLWLTALSSLVLLAYTVTQLGVNTHHTAILSEDLEFWQDYNAFAETFPILDEALLVVVDAETAGEAREAALELAERLAAESELFPDVYVPGGDAFFQRNALLYLDVVELEDLSDQMASVQPLLAEVNRDRSLTHMANVLTEGIERLRTDPATPVDFTVIFDSWHRAVQAVLEGRPKPISWIELILRRKLPGDSARRVIVLLPAFDYDHLLPGNRAIERVREVARELGLVPENGVVVRITGNVALNTEEMWGVAQGAVQATAVSLAVVALILWVALRRVHLVAAAIVTLLVCLVWTAAFGTLAVGHLNVMSVCFAILVIGLGIDFGIHVCMRYAELRRAGEGHEPALQDTARSVGGSLLLCAVTTALGFFVFVPTALKAIGELGLIAGTGMVVSLVATLTVTPALLTAWKDRSVGEGWGGGLWFERILIGTASRHPRGVCAVAALLAVASLAALPRARFDHNPAHLRDPGTESVQTFEDLLNESDTSPWTMDVMAPSLDAAVEIAATLRQLPVVERAVTLQDYVPQQQAEKLEILGELGYFVPEPPSTEPTAVKVPLEQQMVALRALQAAMQAPWLAEGDPERKVAAARAARALQRFFDRLASIAEEQKEKELAEFERSLMGALPAQMRQLWGSLDPDDVTLETLPPQLARRMLASDGRARVEVLPSEDLSDNATHARFVDSVLAVAPAATGGALTILEFGRATSGSFRQAFVSAVLAIALLLWVLWRRVGDMLLVIVPLTLAMLVTTASAVVLDLPFNFANILVLPLLLGIGVDSGIHLVHRHRVAMEESGGTLAPDAELLSTSTAQAVFFSSLTTMASFGTMAFAGHLGFASLGRLLLLGVAFTLLANLVLLPALIALSARARTNAAPPAP